MAARGHSSELLVDLVQGQIAHATHLVEHARLASSLHSCIIHPTDEEQYKRASTLSISCRQAQYSNISDRSRQLGLISANVFSLGQGNFSIGTATHEGTVNAAYIRYRYSVLPRLTVTRLVQTATAGSSQQACHQVIPRTAMQRSCHQGNHSNLYSAGLLWDRDQHFLSPSPFFFFLVTEAHQAPQHGVSDRGA